MGNLFGDANAMARAKPFITFYQAVDNYVNGGDLVFIEEKYHFDDYTEINGQTLHAFKKCLRLKQNLDDFKEIKQWCRVAIVIDSDIDEIKYLLELTSEGFVKTEYMSRILQLKRDHQTFAIRRQMVPLSYRQSKRLRRIADFLSTLNQATGKYRDLYALGQDQLQTDINFMQAKQSKRKERRLDDMGESDDDGEESEEEDPMEYLDLVKSALFETRRILEDIDEHGQLYLQIWEIFNIFCGKLINIDDEDSVSLSSRSEKTAL